MILSDKTIKKEMEKGRLIIKPDQKLKIDEWQIQPASIDLRLDKGALIVDERATTIIDITKKNNIEYIEGGVYEIIIPPRGFVLCSTEEWIELPNDIAGRVEGRSSIGRLGLFIQNAGWVDPGFKGTITLELYNANNLPMKIPAGMRICQLVLSRIDQEATPYDGKYNGQYRPTSSRIYQDEDLFKE